MTNSKDLDYLKRALVSLYRIAFFIEGMTTEELTNDIKTVDAIRYCTLQLGGNINMITDSFQSQNPLKNSADWYFLMEFSHDGFYSLDDLWAVIYSEDIGLVTYFLPQLAEIYEKHTHDISSEEAMPKEKKKRLIDNGSVDTKYKHAIHSNASVWTVRKR